ncbi:uncharacterized protein LOC111054468 [Nilaparvata lugens]|uniref:uncharacterized protein LOC111054468 n=1 Tax=Nilaparvata lugens TaxID=108931 RepID=UPI00193E6C0D|nr:uncharacterized protein LOC111054468 [Nilaparvata lugens]
MASDNLNDSDIDALLEGDFSENSDEDFLLDNSDDDPDYIQQELQNNQDSQSEMDETDENQASDEPATIRPAPQPATIRPAPPRRVGNQRLNTFVWDDEDAVPTVEVFNDNSGVTENFNLDNSSSATIYTSTLEEIHAASTSTSSYRGNADFVASIQAQSTIASPLMMRILTLRMCLRGRKLEFSR